jgi:hypothetical protein
MEKVYTTWDSNVIKTIWKGDGIAKFLQSVGFSDETKEGRFALWPSEVADYEEIVDFDIRLGIIIDRDTNKLETIILKDVVLEPQTDFEKKIGLQRFTFKSLIYDLTNFKDSWCYYEEAES